jgi:hypothetical protein
MLAWLVHYYRNGFVDAFFLKAGGLAARSDKIEPTL